MIKVKMSPHVSEVEGQSNGIARVIEGYFKHLPQFGIELVSPNSTKYDLVAAHAGITGGSCDIAHLHGLYFTADYDANEWEWHVNSRVIEACRNAKAITVPSDWVAETFRRDMRLNPYVVPHGIDWQDWQHQEENRGYVLYNKNRNADVCDNSILDVLCQRFPEIMFVSTLPTPKLSKLSFKAYPENLRIIETGIKTPHSEMKRYVQQMGVYLSVAKETFSVGNLEAMASGKPILGWDWGGNSFLVQHGVNGYLARVGDVNDLCEGLNYCLKHQKTLGNNGRELVKKWTWQAACEQVARVYELAMQEEEATVSVVIPVYNKSVEQVKRAVDSTVNQTYKPKEIIVVNDGSNNAADIDNFLSSNYDNVLYLSQSNQGVANARNNGIAHAHSKYVCCLDADDWLEPTFLEVCVKELESNRSLGIAYAGLRTWNEDGSNTVSQWPGKFNPDAQLTYAKKQNQVPTCCVFRREAWERAGGYKSRYCPGGAGSEDAAFWSAICSIGYNARKVTEEALFNYSAQGGQVHDNREYQEVDWLSMYPWAKDGQHPFASYATPKRHSHAVSQYDQPAISIIIPVGPGHEKEVENALDSLEMQTFRKWEAVVVWDNGAEFNNKFDELKSDTLNLLNLLHLSKSYPYVKYEFTDKRGAGFARNRGVEIARAPLIFFLDADDVLAHSDALKLMLDAWNQQESIIYSDYLGKAVWDYEAASKEFGANLLAYNAKKQTAVFRKKTVDFNSDLAQRQPELSSDPTMPYYHWCLVSVLIPKAWHNEIGGFDESMTTWEDVDYHWRLARAGHCYYRIPEPLVMYAYHKGTRREKSAVTDENSLHAHKSMIQYIKRKYEGLEVKVCNCGSKKQQTTNGAKAVAMSDSDFVLISFDFPGSDTRSSYGKSLKSFSRQTDANGRVLDYQGYARHKGDRFLVHVADQKARPDMFRIVPNEVKVPEVEIKPLEEPRPLTEPDNITQAIEPLIESIAVAQEIPTPKKRGRPKTKA